MSDQAASLRLISDRRDSAPGTGAPETQRPERILAVASGKGGVGKSNIALNLALELASRGRRTYLLDADLGMANAGILAGIQPRHHLGNLLEGPTRLDEIVTRGPFNLGIIAGANGLSEMANLTSEQRRRICRHLEHFNEPLDYLIIDTGAGISVNVLSFVLRADRAFVVTTPEPTALADAYGMIKTIAERRFAGRVSVVVNRAMSIREARAAGERLVALSAQYLDQTVDWAGFVMEDAAVGRAVRRRAPFSAYDRSSTAARSIALLADRIDRGVDNGEAETGIVTGVLRWFERIFG